MITPTTLADALTTIDVLTLRLESVEAVALEVMAERDRAVADLERLGQLSLAELT